MTIPISDKILVFTDLHFGIHSNSQSYIDICSNTLKWISNYCSKNSIKDIVFMGDFFDSRASIDVKTLNSATQSLYELADSGVNISLILGNHDIYLRDSTSIHSLLAFGGRNGIEVVDTPSIRLNKNGDSILFLPWLYGSQSKKITVPENTKLVFSHHNFPPSFFMGATKKKTNRSDTYSSRTPYEDEYGIQQEVLETVVKNEGLFFSGHIHQRKEIPVGKSSKIIIEGSPYETSWGFGGVKCGAYVVDTINADYEFVENPFNMVHAEIRTSSPDEDFNKIDFPRSIVRLNVDTQESFDTISKLQAKINSKKPFAVENTKYEFTVAEFVGSRDEKNDGTVQQTVSGKVFSKLDYVLNAIDKSDFSMFSFIKDDETVHVDKRKLKDMATDLFESGNKRA